MKRFITFFQVLLVSLLISSAAFAQRIEYFTDIEGRVDIEKQLIDEGLIKIVADVNSEGGQRYVIVEPNTQFIFNGDYIDRGPYSLRIMKFLTKFKNDNKDLVTTNWGNHESKISFVYDAAKMEKLQLEYYNTFLEQKFQELPTEEQAGKTKADLNTKANQLLGWAREYGFMKAIEFHQQEMRELGHADMTLSEAVLDYRDLISNPSREYFKFMQTVVMAYDKPGPIFAVHGGLPAEDGFLPDSSELAKDYESWAKSYNKWASETLNAIIQGINEGHLPEQGKKLVFITDSVWDGKLGLNWNHDNSPVYGPRYKEGHNLALPPEHTLEWLRKSGKTLGLYGHTPAANIGQPLRAKDFLLFMTDTSYAPNGLYTRYSINGENISVSGKLADGTAIKYTTSARDTLSPIGKRIGDEVVVATLGKDKYVLFKYQGASGRDISERVVPVSEVPFSSLKAPIVTDENAEFESQKRTLFNELAKLGIKPIELNMFEADVLNGRTAVIFSGSSAFADTTQEPLARKMIEDALKALDPSKVVIVTGATDSGPERFVHEIAKKMGFYVHGLLVSAAVPKEVAKNLNSYSWVGHAWADQPKTAMELIKALNGFGIIIGGGGLLKSALEYGKSIGARFLVAANIKHGNGNESASMAFAKQDKMRELSFSSGDALVRILKRSFYSTLKKNIIEASPERAIEEIKNRGKKVATFIGFSGQGYENPELVLKQLDAILDGLDAKNTLINIGGTPDGIGILYERAKQRGFETIGIVSSLSEVGWLSPYVDRIYLIKDKVWGGFINGSKVLAPTSRAIVAVTDLVFAIGGGVIGRDEFLSLIEKGVPATYIKALANKAKAIARAVKANKPEPTEFRGDLELFLTNNNMLKGDSMTWNIEAKIRSASETIKSIIEKARQAEHNKVTVQSLTANSPLKVQVGFPAESKSDNSNSKSGTAGPEILLSLQKLVEKSPELAKIVYQMNIVVEVFAPGANAPTKTIVITNEANMNAAIDDVISYEKESFDKAIEYKSLIRDGKYSETAADKKIGIIDFNELSALKAQLLKINADSAEAKVIRQQINNHAIAVRAKQFALAKKVAVQTINELINIYKTDIYTSPGLKETLSKVAASTSKKAIEPLEVDTKTGEVIRGKESPIEKTVGKARRNK
jgi:hypothetical protein